MPPSPSISNAKKNAFSTPGGSGRVLFYSLLIATGGEFLLGSAPSPSSYNSSPSSPCSSYSPPPPELPSGPPNSKLNDDGKNKNNSNSYSYSNSNVEAIITLMIRHEKRSFLFPFIFTL